MSKMSYKGEVSLTIKEREGKTGMEQEQDPNQVCLPPRGQNPKSKGESRIQCVDLEVLRCIEVKITRFDVEMKREGRRVNLGLVSWLWSGEMS